jgi:single-stranded-DNA-specific exonuclease
MEPGSSRAETRLEPPRASWKPPRRPDQLVVSELVEGLGLPEVLCSLLAVRSVDEVGRAKRFLRPRLEHLHDPALLADGVRAAERVVEAIGRGETILVHGDYDVDGICATALLTRWLRGLGAEVVPFVPHRLRDGYDFSDAGIQAAVTAGASLVVTADCGTVAHATIDEARRRDVEVIVTDHHTVGSAFPAAHALVNPQRLDCGYPGKALCGTGVAYKLCQLIGTLLNADLDALDEYLDLVALATVADLVPLTGENRVLVSYGLRRFARSRIVGVDALLEAAGVAPASVTAGQLGYVVAPRINAAGRIAEPSDALRLLLTDDPREAADLASRLELANVRRREEDRRTLDEAVERLIDEYDGDRDYGVVLASEGWHPGVIGIVASRVVERIHRPVVLVALDGERGRGSARSIPGFHLYEALAECAPHLRRFGGHRQAAGMDVDRQAIPALRHAFNEAAARRLQPDQLRPVLTPDVELRLSDADLQLVHWMGYLGPHGIGNPGPLFLARDVAFDRPKVVGDGHLKLVVVQAQARLDAIGFGLAERFPVESLGARPHDVLFRLERNEWRGAVRPQARLIDVRPSEERV